MGTVSLVSLVHILQAPKSGGSPTAGLGQISCCLPSIRGGRMAVKAELTGKDHQGA